MNSHDRQTELDTEVLSPEEQRIAALYRSLPAGQPSPALDARIRAQAHGVVRPRRPVWLWGAGVAASAVLALGLFWRMGLPEMQQPDPSTSNDSASSQLRNDTVVLDSIATSPPSPPEPPRAGAAAPSPAASVMRERDEALDASKPASPAERLSADQAGDERGPGSPQPLAQSARERSAAAAVIAATPAEKQESFAIGRAGRVAETKTEKAATKVAEPPRLKRAEVAADELLVEEERAALATKPVSTPAPEPPPPPIIFDEPSPMAIQAPPPAPPAPPAAPVELPEQEPAVATTPKAASPRTDGADSESERQQLGKLKDADAMAAVIAELPRAYRHDVEKNAKLYPASWLGRIETLLAADKREEAVANLRVFLLAYPGHELPDALATLAREERLDGDTKPRP